MRSGAPVLDSGDEVTAQVVLDDRRLSGGGRSTLLRLSWHDQDPLAVHLLITSTPDHPSLPRGHWVLLRDLLRSGLQGPTGEGMIRIFPEDPRGRVRFELQRETGVCRVWVPRGPLERFLAATEAIVPAGCEHTGDALDALLAQVLAGGS